jgi:hypothetical protein
MSDAPTYVPGQPADAARRLATQGATFAEAPEALLDDAAIPPP